MAAVRRAQWHFVRLVCVPGLSSDATVLTPNTESSCDLMTKTKSTSGNDDSTSLDLEWEDEEGLSPCPSESHWPLCLVVFKLSIFKPIKKLLSDFFFL